MMSFSSIFSLRTGSRRASGFSLIEVTLALGIVTFALVGAVGVLPTALSSSRQSFNKNRASAIADTLFASFRSSPFQSVGYLDEQFDNNGSLLPNPATPLLDLNLSVQANASQETIPPNGVQFYAAFLDGFTPANLTDPLSFQRHIRFAKQPLNGSDFLVTMYFNNQPSGAVISPQANVNNKPPVIPAQANQIELIISAVSQEPEIKHFDQVRTDQYHFVTTVANRTN